MVEKRRYPRFPVHYDLTYRNIKKPTENKKRGIVENVSRTGLKLRLPSSLKENDILELTIFKSVASRPIHGYGKVIWHKESTLVYGEKVAGIFLTKIGWTETGRLVNNTT